MEIFFFVAFAKLPEISGWLVHWDYNFTNHEHILTLIMSHLYTKKLDINIFFTILSTQCNKSTKQLSLNKWLWNMKCKKIVDLGLDQVPA